MTVATAPALELGDVATGRAPALVSVPVSAPSSARPATAGRPDRADPVRLAGVRVLHPPADSGAARPIRLTRRGVRALALLVVASCTALLWLAVRSAPVSATGSTSGSSPGSSSPDDAAVTVEAGDTLWSIASRVAPQRDPRIEVALLQRRNGLPADYVITPGQQLLVP